MRRARNVAPTEFLECEIFDRHKTLIGVGIADDAAASCCGLDHSARWVIGKINLGVGIVEVEFSWGKRRLRCYLNQFSIATKHFFRINAGSRCGNTHRITADRGWQRRFLLGLPRCDPIRSLTNKTCQYL